MKTDSILNKIKLLPKPNKQIMRRVTIVTLLVACGAFLRILGRNINTSSSSFVIGIMRGTLYICLFTAWGFSLRQRIIQTQAKRFLTAVSALIVFWVLARTLKYMFFADTHIGRLLWYLYYIPMLFIPLLLLLIALSLGKSERFRLPFWTNTFYGISALLVILVLTNDYHQLVFGFSSSLLEFDNGEYTHCFVYYVIIGWASVCIATAFGFIVARTRVPYSKKLFSFRVFV